MNWAGQTIVTPVVEYLMFNVGVGWEELAVTTSLLPSGAEATAYQFELGALVGAVVPGDEGGRSIGMRAYIPPPSGAVHRGNL